MDIQKNSHALAITVPSIRKLAQNGFTGKHLVQAMSSVYCLLYITGKLSVANKIKYNVLQE